MTSARGLHISAETDKDEFMSQERGQARGSSRKRMPTNRMVRKGLPRSPRAQPSGDGHVQPGL